MGKNLIIKPAYGAAYFGSGRKVSSEAELRILMAVDNLMLTVRQTELSGESINIFDTIQDHVNAAYEYYSGFSRSDMLKLELMSLIMNDTTDDAEEEEVL